MVTEKFCQFNPKKIKLCCIDTHTAMYNYVWLSISLHVAKMTLWILCATACKQFKIEAIVSGQLNVR